MNKKRLSRVNDEIRREIAEIIRTEIKDPRIGTLTSVTDVVTASDLAVSKVYVSILGDDEQKRKVMEGLKSATGFIRKTLASRLNLRNTPEIKLVLDESIEKAAHLNQLIENANNPQNGEDA